MKSTPAYAPWPAGELSRLLASARTMPGDVGEIPARLWWPALVLAITDTTVGHAELVERPVTAFDRSRGTLAAGGLVRRLHPLSVEALDALRHYRRERLLPWPLDRGGPINHMLVRTFRELLYRAGLPHVKTNLPRRLQITGQRIPDILDRVDLDYRLQPRQGRPTYVRPRDLRRWRQGRRKSGPKSKRPDPESLPEDSLRRVFETAMLPQQLAPKGAKKSSIGKYRAAVGHFAEFLGAEPALSHLTDDALQSFLAWLVETGRTQATANGDRAALLGLWRFAWRKKLIDDQPRDVPKLPEPKRLPVAWSLEEFGRILDSAWQCRGEVYGVPARLWWTGLLLVGFDTGLRRSAALSVETAGVDLETRILFADWRTQKHRTDEAWRLHPDTCDVLRASRPETRTVLFPCRWGCTRFNRHYRAILKRAGLPSTAKDLFHKIRRTSATYVCDKAGPEAAQRHMGHSTVRLTLTNYIDPTKLTGRRYASDLMERPAWNRPEADTVPFARGA